MKEYSAFYQEIFCKIATFKPLEKQWIGFQTILKRREVLWFSVVKQTREMYDFRNDNTSEVATKLYVKLQRSQVLEQHKIVATLLAAPLSAIDNDEKSALIKAISWCLRNDMFPCRDEEMAVQRLLNIGSSPNPLVISHAGKFFSEKELYSENGKKKSFWVPYSELSEKLCHAVKGPRKVDKVYFPTEADMLFKSV